MKYLEYYESCMKTGKLKEGNGLCGEELGALLRQFLPVKSDHDALDEEGLCTTYWASGLDTNLFSMGDRLETEFTPLRQTIVLFLAAISGEL